jgi:hypothetical protein
MYDQDRNGCHVEAHLEAYLCRLSLRSHREIVEGHPQSHGKNLHHMADLGWRRRKRKEPAKLVVGAVDDTVVWTRTP